MIYGKDISLVYDDQPVLNSISFEVPASKITAFVGESGAGKTSLFSCIAQLNDVYTGSVQVGSVSLASAPVRSRAGLLGVVQQQGNLFPHLTALENCVQPQVVVWGVHPKVAVQKVLVYFERFGLEGCVDKLPKEISGGQQQRVALIRTLCTNPQALLLDEPTSALDPANAALVAEVLQEVSAQGMAVAMVSHDLEFVTACAQRIYLLDEGRILTWWDAGLHGGQAADAEPIVRLASPSGNH